MRSLYARTILPVLPLLLDASASTIHCPIQGPEFPIPQRLSSSIFIQSAKDAFVTQLQSGAVPLNVSAFSVGVFSLDETEPLFEYHNSPPWVATSKDGVKKIDSNTVYRIASVSKLYTVWLLLIKAGEAILSDPITKYIPELATAGKSKDSGIQDGFDDIRQVKWDEMTVGDLARQISGIIRDRKSISLY